MMRNNNIFAEITLRIRGLMVNPTKDCCNIVTSLYETNLEFVISLQMTLKLLIICQ